jgi:hypothetical protein
MPKGKSKLQWVVAGGALGAAIYAFVVRPWHLRLGATDEELEMPLPCDEFVERPKLNATHAITINAPTSTVWSWLVQIGQNRAGFYSYTWLENLVGCRMPNVNRIVPEWQDLTVGDEVWLHPKAPPLKVLALEPGRFIALEKCWTFYLCPLDQRRTRLIVRGRGDYYPDFKSALLNFVYYRLLFEPAHFIMERKMMLGLKDRAETTLTGTS